MIKASATAILFFIIYNNRATHLAFKLGGTFLAIKIFQLTVLNFLYISFFQEMCE